MSELEEKVEGQSREMEALQTQNDDLNSLVKVSPVASADWDFWWIGTCSFIPSLVPPNFPCGG